MGEAIFRTIHQMQFLKLAMFFPQQKKRNVRQITYAVLQYDTDSTSQRNNFLFLSHFNSAKISISKKQSPSFNG